MVLYLPPSLPPSFQAWQTGVMVTWPIIQEISPTLSGMMESSTDYFFGSSHVAPGALIRPAWTYWLVHDVARPQAHAITPSCWAGDLGHIWHSREEYTSIKKSTLPASIDDLESP